MKIPGLTGNLMDVGSQMVNIMYEIYIAGIADGRNGGKFPSLHDFAKNSKSVHLRGQQLSRTVSMNGERAYTAVDEKKSD